MPRLAQPKHRPERATAKSFRVTLPHSATGPGWPDPHTVQPICHRGYATQYSVYFDLSPGEQNRARLVL